jgi:hypothetical protein
MYARLKHDWHAHSISGRTLLLNPAAGRKTCCQSCPCHSAALHVPAAAQNNSIDIYEQYFSGFTSDHTTEVPSAKTMTVFKDPAAIARNVSCINWTPDSGSKAVVAYAILAFQQQPAGMSLSSYVWDLNNPNVPEAELLAPSQLVCARFNLKDSNLVGAGQYNGQFSYFDMRKGTGPVESTPMDICHRYNRSAFTGDGRSMG